MLLTILIYVTMCSCLWASLAQGGERLTAEALLNLPTLSPEGIAPHLEMRWSNSDPEQFDLMAKLHAWHGIVVFNPFGSISNGCPYYIVITDSNGSVVGQVNKVMPANEAIPGPDAWVRVRNDRVVGRVFSRFRDFSLVDRQAEPVDPARSRDWFFMRFEVEPTPDLVTLKEGEYLLYLLVTKRLESERLIRGDDTGFPERQQRWMTDELDSVTCRSPALRFRVGQDGKVKRPTDVSATPQPPIRVTTEVLGRDLRIEAIKIAKREHRSIDPGLALDSILGIEVAPPKNAVDQSSHGRFFSSSLLKDRLSPRFVPKGAIIGYVDDYPGPIVAGRYNITVRFPKDLWMDQEMDSSEADAMVNVDITEEQIDEAVKPK